MKERVEKVLPRLNKEILELVSAWEAENGEPLGFDGTPIAQLIAEQERTQGLIAAQSPPLGCCGQGQALRQQPPQGAGQPRALEKL